MRIFYQGNERLQWFFSTPNEFGCVVAIALVGLATFTVVNYPDSRPAVVIRLSGICALAFLLGMTYSRGSIVAAFVGLAVAVVIGRKAWRFGLVTVALIFASLLWVPAGVKRFESATNMSEGSIRNRISLWCGISAMATTEAAWGQGRNYFDDTYAPWYHERKAKTVYFSGVSNPATVLAFFGIGGFALFSLFTICGVSLAIFNTREHKPVAGCGSLVVQVTYVTAAIFSTAFAWPLPLTLYSGAVIAAIIGFNWRRILAEARVLAAYSLGALLLVGIVVYAGRRTYVDLQPYTMSVRYHAWGLERTFIPKGQLDDRSVVLVFLRKSETTMFAKTLVRGFAEISVQTEVMVVSDEDFVMDAFAVQVLEQLKLKDRRVPLVFCGRSADDFIVTASKRPQMAELLVGRNLIFVSPDQFGKEVFAQPVFYGAHICLYDADRLLTSQNLSATKDSLRVLKERASLTLWTLSAHILSETKHFP